MQAEWPALVEEEESTILGLSASSWYVLSTTWNTWPNRVGAVASKGGYKAASVLCTQSSTGSGSMASHLSSETLALVIQGELVIDDSGQDCSRHL